MSLCVLVTIVAANASLLEARSSVHLHRKSSKVASSIQHHESPDVGYSIHHHNSPHVKRAHHLRSSSAHYHHTSKKHIKPKSSKHHHRKGRKHHASNSSAISHVSSNLLGQHKGQGTWYNTGLGACGITSTDSDRIVALSKDLFDLYTPGGNPNNNQLCGAKIHVVYNNNTSTVTVLDRCVGCQKFDLDLSPTAFKDLADPDIGRIDIDWEFE